MAMAGVRRTYTAAQMGVQNASIAASSSLDTVDIDCAGAFCVVFRLIGVSSAGTGAFGVHTVNFRPNLGRPDRVTNNALNAALAILTQFINNTDQTNGRASEAIIFPVQSGFARLPFVKVGLHIVTTAGVGGMTNVDCEADVYWLEGG